MIAVVEERNEPTLALGPVGLGGLALLALGILSRRRFLSLLGIAGVAADVTVAELGGFKAMNETRPVAADDATPSV